MASHTAQPGELAGGFTAPDTFEVQRSVSFADDACTGNWTLSGSFTRSDPESRPDRFTATFSSTFSGACGDCSDQSWAVTGTR